MTRNPAQIRAERERNKRFQSVTIRFDEDEQRWLETLRRKMKYPSPSQLMKGLFVLEITKRGIDMDD